MLTCYLIIRQPPIKIILEELNFNAKVLCCWQPWVPIAHTIFMYFLQFDKSFDKIRFLWFDSSKIYISSSDHPLNSLLWKVSGLTNKNSFSHIDAMWRSTCSCDILTMSYNSATELSIIIYHQRLYNHFRWQHTIRHFHSLLRLVGIYLINNQCKIKNMNANENFQTVLLAPTEETDHIHIFDLEFLGLKLMYIR